jgi:hypothetical protein
MIVLIGQIGGQRVAVNRIGGDPRCRQRGPRAALEAACSMLDKLALTLDRGVRLVYVHLDDEFELVIGGHFASE